jgi:hypothetical protein
MSSHIDYGRLMHSALRQLMAEVLTDVSANGLPGDHHFYISFDTSHPGVDMADWLRERYPDDMTIVIQHWFDNLAVMSDRFTITLNFGNAPEPLVIPFDAVKTFVDPSVEFGLRFDGVEDDEAEAPETVQLATLQESLTELSETEQPESERSKDDQVAKGEVVSLDTFRKN